MWIIDAGEERDPEFGRSYLQEQSDYLLITQGDLGSLSNMTRVESLRGRAGKVEIITCSVISLKKDQVIKRMKKAE